MGSSRRSHVLLHAALVIGAAGVASGVASGGPDPAPPDPDTGGQSADEATPAGSSPVESSDVPDLATAPQHFAVTPFVNRSTTRSFDWLIAGVPFEIAEKTEEVLGLEPTGGPLRVGGTPIDPNAAAVAVFGGSQEATWVITGWVDRPNWQLRIGATLWKVDLGASPIARVTAEAERTGDPKAYHQLLGELIGALWSDGANVQIDLARAAQLQRTLSRDVYSVNLMGRGLGHLLGVIGGKVDLKAAQHDLERSTFIDPKCSEAQRLVGELYLVLATADPKDGGSPRYASRAAGKFNYAYDLAPDSLGAIRAAAGAATRAGKFEVARELLRKLVTRKPWDIDARYHYGAALWETGNATEAERQLEQVTSRDPDHLPARRVLVLIHSARGDTSKLLAELEAIAKRAPDDLDVKSDLATAYGAVGRWDRAATTLEQIAAERPSDFSLAIRIGHARRLDHDLDGALVWYTRAQRLSPDTSMPGFLTAQALFDAKRYEQANRYYTNLLKFRDDMPAAEHALGAIALVQNVPSRAAWYLRRAVKGDPRVIAAWRALIAAELARRDHETAQQQLERALGRWPDDTQLLYLSGIARALAGDRPGARTQFEAALAHDPRYGDARTAIGQLDVGADVPLVFVPEIPRIWGDAAAIEAALDRFRSIEGAMAKVRESYQTEVLDILAAFGKGPHAPTHHAASRYCPVDRVAPLWAHAQTDLAAYDKLGVELEASYRFIHRHEEVGMTSALLPGARTRVATVRKRFATALADAGELRAEWTRGAVPELRHGGCSDKLLAAAVADPEHYRVIQDDTPDTIPAPLPPRPRPRATFYVDNTTCSDAVDVWIDGIWLGQVAPGHRSALVADGGDRTLCLIGPGAAQCGDRGTVREVYLHDGWTATLNCPN